MMTAELSQRDILPSSSTDWWWWDDCYRGWPLKSGRPEWGEDKRRSVLHQCFQKCLQTCHIYFGHLKFNPIKRHLFECGQSLLNIGKVMLQFSHPHQLDSMDWMGIRVIQTIGKKDLLMSLWMLQVNNTHLMKIKCSLVESLPSS